MTFIQQQMMSLITFAYEILCDVAVHSNRLVAITARI